MTTVAEETRLNNNEHILITRLDGCARCGGDHEDLNFQRLDQPMEISGVQFTHWGTCPETGSPILLRVDTYTA